jgi:hypothetical protein
MTASKPTPARIATITHSLVKMLESDRLARRGVTGRSFRRTVPIAGARRLTPT